jgi:ABC-type nitrate/sulfonate/bicarbonate transport system substrate-binding protein
MDVGRRQVLRDLATGAIIAGTGLLAKPTSAPAASRVKISGNVNRTLNNANFIVATAKGFFAEEGVDAEFPTSFLSQPELIQLLSGSQIDIAHVSASPQGNNAVLRGAPIRIIAGGAKLPRREETSASYLLVREDTYQKGIRTVADLKGKTIDIWPGFTSPAGRGASLILESGGLKRDDVQWTNWSNLSQLGQAFEAGTVQIAYVLEPMATIVRKKVPTRVLGTGTQVIGGTVVLVVWANTRWLDANPRGAVQFLKGLLRGANYYCDARDSRFSKNTDVIDILSTGTNIDPALVREVGLPDFCRDGTFDMKDIQDEAAFLKSVEALKEVARFDQASILDLSYARQAFAELQKEGKI